MCEENCCGCVGPQGPQGVPGSQGSQGIQGPSGKDGAQGPVGPQGSNGRDGAPGAEGPMGPQGPVGVQGSQGQQGPMGPQGASGSNGQMGAQGPQGPQGIPGAQGSQGIQGVPGKDCADSCCTRWYAECYSLKAQTIASLGTPILEFSPIVSVAFDVSMAAISGEIKVLKHGIYFVNWGVDGGLTPPFPFPVPSWAFGVYRNGVLLPSSTSGSFTSSPDDVTTHCSADFEVELMAGDIIKLVNISSLPINVVSSPLGVLFPIAAARINIFQLVGLP